MTTPLHLIPTPRLITGEADEAGRYPAKAFAPALLFEEPLFELPARSLSEQLESIYSVSAPAADTKSCATVRFVLCPTLKEGAYRVESAGDRVQLLAADEQGAFYAVSTLLQLIKQTPEGMFLPVVKIEDAPLLPFTSVMIDLARVWHDFEYLLRYVDLCAFYKIQVLHLHFTDDQSYTLPSRLFPKLSTPNRSYSFKEIRTLNEYARRRGVQLMPEIDVPGHCIAFQTNYSELFGTGGIIIQTEESMKAMKALFAELCELFPDSRYVHIGGDEAVISKWLEKDFVNPYYDTLGLDLSSPDKEFLQERLLANFVNEMANTVFECGKQPVAWEGFKKCVSDFVRKDLLMISWENYYQTATELLDSGFRIINVSWEPMYVCTPRKYWTPRNMYDWNIYTWIPVHYHSPYYQSKLEIEEDPRVIGGGLCSWNDSLIRVYEPDQIPEALEEELRMVCERVPMLSERTWHPQKKQPKSFDDYLKAVLPCMSKAKRLF